MSRFDPHRDRVRALASVLALLVAGANAPAAPGAPVSDHPIETDADRVPRLKTGGSCVVRGATVHSAVEPPRVADVLVVEGRIEAIGEVEAPEGLVEIDAAGLHLAPGVVDCHSHMAIERGVNEGTMSITAEVRIADVVDGDDIAIYRALAGGVTTVRLLHGSANAIGGQDAVLKLRWGRTAEELLFDGAEQGVKFALGENPKRSNWGERASRFPGSRMGVEAVYVRAFESAREYMRLQSEYEAHVAAGKDPLRPRRDLRLEALADILRGRIKVHCHCYRADGILMMIRTAERFGFELATLQHVLEGYKVAKEMADAGVGGSTFGDWWSYKFEAYDAIPQNAALMDEAGVLSSLNSDSDEMVRRLYGEAAKSVRYAGMDPVRALALVTLFPARQLGIGDRVGSIEQGKDADLVLLSAEPLSARAVVQWTMIDGEIAFQRRDAFDLAGRPDEPRFEAPAPREPLDWNPEGGQAVAITGGTVHPATAEPIEEGTVLFQDGRILYVGPEARIPAGARVIDAAGRHVWPGMIALNTALGLREIGAVRATVDDSEIGGNQPDLRAVASVNADSAHIGVTLYNGITRAQTTPGGRGPITGQSAVLRLTGDTWEELVTLDRDMLHVEFPRVRNDEDDKETPEDAVELHELLDDAREHGRLLDDAAETGSEPPAFDPRLAALAPYARGERRVALHASNAQSILYALQFLEAEPELDAVLYGAQEGWKVADALAAAHVPVVVGPVLALPRSRFDPYDSVYANPAVLHRAGVDIALMSDDEENPRNLPFHAAMAAAFGLPPAEALRAITLAPARVLGLEEELGSLEPGKLADVIVTSGDLLDIRSTVDYVFVDGRQAELSNRHTEFYERYRARLHGLQEEER